MSKAVFLRANDGTNSFEWGILGKVFTGVCTEGHGHFLGVDGPG